ncbi:MAG: DNA polymerase III subunit gamma/tau [Thiolinea sp.]
MSYQVLARKWRPQNFEQMVGQQHVLRALLNSLNENRLHHAYLFTGTRGVGKTTIARIFAKSLNCETGITATPCGVCRSCLEIADGRHVDLLEVDAASRTKVEDTRDLLDNVQYAPTHGRFKIYLIDEVHMLSSHSFNALLKTLEEPPPHVKFLFATTDPQKLPVTILSRCLQFNLKRMSPDMISGYLSTVLAEESIEHTESALRVIARAADGSMRDALSLTDQAIVTGEGKVLDEAVQDMLGMLPHEHLLALLQALVSGDAEQVLSVIDGMAQLTTDFLQAADSLISLLHQLAITQIMPQDDLDADLKALAEQISSADLQLYYQMALYGRRDMPLNPDPRSGFEMLLLRMLAFQLDGQTKTPLQSGDTKKKNFKN